MYGMVQLTVVLFSGAFSTLQLLQKHVSKHTIAQYKCVYNQLIGANRPVNCRDRSALARPAPEGKVWRRDSKTSEWTLVDDGHCDMTFATPSAARNHILMRHLNWKGYYCRFNEVTGINDTSDGNPCTARYYRTDDIRAHVMTYHINFKAYRCDVCDFRTADIGILRVRKQFHHNCASDLILEYRTISVDSTKMHWPKWRYVQLKIVRSKRKLFHNVME